MMSSRKIRVGVGYSIFIEIMGVNESSCSYIIIQKEYDQ